MDKNSKIKLILNNNEEILCTGEKNQKEFYVFTFYYSFVLFVCVILLIHGLLEINNKSNLTPPNDLFSITVVFVFILYNLYLFIKGYYTNIILTNERLIIEKFNKTTVYQLNEIETLTSHPEKYNTNITPTGLLIKLKTSKKIIIPFVKNEIINIFLKNKTVNYEHQITKDNTNKKKFAIINIVIGTIILVLGFIMEFYLLH